MHPLSRQSTIVDLINNKTFHQTNTSMDTYGGSESSYGPEPLPAFDALLFDDVGDEYANENFQANLDPGYNMETLHFNTPQEVVQEEVSLPQHPDGYLSSFNLWYDIASGPDGGAHYLRQIRWHHPRPAPAIVPQWPAAAVAQQALADDPDGYNPTLKVWYNLAVAEAPGADFYREIGWYTVVPAPDGMPQEASTPIVAPLRPQIPVYRAAPRISTPRPRVAKGRNPKKNSIIQKCICRPQYSTVDVPRPPNQYICFRVQESTKLQREYIRDGGQKLRHDQISKILGAKWNAMSDVERAPYKAQADRLAAEHKLKYPGWSFKPGQKAAHQFGSMSCTCGAYQINVTARERRAQLGEEEPPMKKKGRGPGRKFADMEPEFLPEYNPAPTPTLRKRKQRDEEYDYEQPTPKRSTRNKTPVRSYNEDDDESEDSLFMPMGDEGMEDAPAEDDDYVVAPGKRPDFTNFKFPTNKR